ncbi:MAG: hypothetical protein IJW24_02705 [Clostridia bacterium]|nr:hypothetical protein [Clostridia bacterium]
MKMKFHNKLEIDVNGKNKFVCYNTVLDSLFEKLGKLEPYFTHFALGSGKTSANPSTTKKLGAYVCSLEASTSEIKCDPADGVFFIKKSASFSSSDNEEIVFSEVGIAASADTDPDIFNHILVTDENGNVTDVVKHAGESLEIKLTIFLELESGDVGLLTNGDNNLVRLLLGDNLEDRTIVASRGTNLSPNIAMERGKLRNAENFVADVSGAWVSDTQFETTISAKLGEGEAREIVLLNSGLPVARINIEDAKNAVTGDAATLTSGQFGALLLGENVKDVLSVCAADGTVIETPVIKAYGKNFGDFALADLDGFDANTPRFVSACGKMIAFVDDYGVHIFRCKDFGLEKIQSGAISSEGVENVCMVGSAVFVKRTTAPFLELYEIKNSKCEKQNLFMENFNESSYSFNFSEMCVVELLSGKYLLGVIESESQDGLALKFSNTGTGFILEEILVTAALPCERILPIIKHGNEDARIFFVTGNYPTGVTPYGLEIIGETKSGFGHNSEAQNMMGAISVTGNEAFIAMKLSASPYFRLYDTKNIDRFTPGSNLMTEFVSAAHDMSYVACKNADGELMVYAAVSPDNFEYVDVKIFDEIGRENITDIVFLENVMIVVTANQIFAVLIDTKFKAVKFLTGSTDYSVIMSKYNFLGAAQYEGVKVDLKLTFTKEV